MMQSRNADAIPKRLLLLGATGTIGRATARALAQRGHDLVCFVRPGADVEQLPPAAEYRFGDVTNRKSLADQGFRGETFDALVSCLASRTGTKADAWRVDHHAHQHALACARAAGVQHFLLLSAICLQKPQLAFQHAKLAFEKTLLASDITWSIVRPTAYFKSLSGQVERVRQGKPFLLFGDGHLTACKPISDNDLANYLADCVEDPRKHNRILPIGGPGPALTPRQQGDMLFALLRQPPRFRHFPVRMMDAIVAVLSAVGRIVPMAAEKAELARIGRYYATESMLVWNPQTGRYHGDATPETGYDTLADHYRQLISGAITHQRSEQSVF